MQKSRLIVLVGMWCALMGWETSAALKIQNISFAGASGDAVVGTAILADGSIVLAANISGGPLVAAHKSKLSRGKGFVIALGPDGKTITASRQVGTVVHDLAIDGQDNVYVATAEGAVKLLAKLNKTLWRKNIGGVCHRIDAAPDGHCVALKYDNGNGTTTGAGRMTVIDPKGRVLSQFKGHRHTTDACIDSKSKTVVHLGWRQANAHDGKKTFPVQIAYLRGVGFDGKVKYLLYDWSTDRAKPGFLNKMTNNMADTRGYRCSIGADGLLYAAFECAGGNHIFRWEPTLKNDAWQKADGKSAKADKYHAFYNSGAEHKTFIGRYEPGTGRYLRGQGFCARLSSGKANAVRVKEGAVTATSSGAVLLGGTSAYGLPISHPIPKTGDYSGGGFLLAMNKELAGRLYCTRYQAGASTRAVAARKVKGKLVVVAGGSINSKKSDEFATHNAIQEKGFAGAGFFAIHVGR